MKTVYCPVIDGQVDGTTCLEIVEVADGRIDKKIFADYDKKFTWNEEQRQKCLACKWHEDISDGN